MRVANFRWLSMVTGLVRYVIAEPGYAEISIWHGKECYDDEKGIGLLAVDTALNGCFRMPFEVFSFSVTEKATPWGKAYVDFCYSGCNDCDSIVPAEMAGDYCYRPNNLLGRGYYTIRNRFTKREDAAGPDPIDSEQALNETTGLSSEPSQLERRSGRMQGVRALKPWHGLLQPYRFYQMIPLVVGGDTYRIISCTWILRASTFPISTRLLGLARTALRLGGYVQDLTPHVNRYGAGLRIDVAYQCTKALVGAINPFHESLIPLLFDQIINAIDSYTQGGSPLAPQIVQMTVKVLHARTGAEQEWRIGSY